MASAEITSRRSGGSPLRGIEHGELIVAPRPAAHRVAGFGLTAIGASSLVAWFAWRSNELGGHPVEWAFLLTEILGVVAALVIAAGLSRADGARGVYAREAPDSHWFALAVADIVGRTRVDDLYREVRSADRSDPLWRPRSIPDAAMSAVLFEGPRRIALVLAVSFGLLLGVSPFTAPPPWAAVAAVVG